MIPGHRPTAGERQEGQRFLLRYLCVIADESIRRSIDIDGDTLSRLVSSYLSVFEVKPKRVKRRETLDSLIPSGEISVRI